MTRVLLSSNPVVLATALKQFARTATVEAEYGNTVVEGSVLTLAHHTEAYRHCPSPCTRPVEKIDLDAVGISHVDLDTIGGVLSLLGTKPLSASFWALAGAVDVRGAHRIEECRAQVGALLDDVRQLQEFWAFSEARRVFAPRDGGILDVTDVIEEFSAVLDEISVGDESRRAAGAAFVAKGEALNASSFIRVESTDSTPIRVVVRRSESFVNHLYATPSGVVCDAVVTLNPKMGAVTVSFAEAPAVGQGTAKEVVQALWGPEAGGHAGIAGSPRGQVMTSEDHEKCVAMTLAARNPHVRRALGIPD